MVSAVSTFTANRSPDNFPAPLANQCKFEEIFELLARKKIMTRRRRVRSDHGN